MCCQIHGFTNTRGWLRATGSFATCYMRSEHERAGHLVTQPDANTRHNAAHAVSTETAPDARARTKLNTNTAVTYRPRTRATPRREHHANV
eukprot:15444116-Alexandrium_andersonii.AAC.2